ncbi:MAG: hypothetical protein IPN71_01965 [Fibrobacteres bacterium]|jgi:hypothetical protein|nr:hypothetical protein [Fibrobacterota bacterium]
MSSPRLLLALLATLLACQGCTEDRLAGNSSETENTIAVRMISVDSLYHGWPPHPSYPTVATLRLDTTHCDFSSIDSAGRQLVVERLDGRQIPFERIFWDHASKRARLYVRLAPDLLRHGSRFRLRWGAGAHGQPDSAAVWDSISESFRVILTSTLVDDFEDGNLLSMLTDTSTWHSGAGEAATATPARLAAAGRGRQGNALTFTYSADANSGRYSTISLVLNRRPLSLRSLDSIVLWARGSGRLSVALDRPSDTASPKAWARIPLDTAWNRLRIAPGDFDPPDNVGGNIGWLRMRDSITHLTFLVEGGSQLWIDDVRLHGIVADDLR